MRSQLKQIGTFYLQIDLVGCSWNFRIARDVFKRAYYLTMRSYYGQRCGTQVDLGSEFPGYRHATCHVTGGFELSSGVIGNHAQHMAGIMPVITADML